MSRKDRREAMRAAFHEARVALTPAWTGDTAARMAAIQSALHTINNSRLKINYNGLPQLYEDMLAIAINDPDFPPESLAVLRRLVDKVEEAVEMATRQNERFHHLAEDIVDTYMVWDKHAKR
jgi:hypothetical protein